MYWYQNSLVPSHSCWDRNTLAQGHIFNTNGIFVIAFPLKVSKSWHQDQVTYHLNPIPRFLITKSIYIITFPLQSFRIVAPSSIPSNGLISILKSITFNRPVFSRYMDCGTKWQTILCTSAETKCFKTIIILMTAFVLKRLHVVTPHSIPPTTTSHTKIFNTKGIVWSPLFLNVYKSRHLVAYHLISMLEPQGFCIIIWILAPSSISFIPMSIQSF